MPADLLKDFMVLRINSPKIRNYQAVLTIENQPIDREHSLEIFSLDGRRIIQMNSNNFNKRVDVSGLLPGIYFIAVIEDGKRIAGGKFVIGR